MLPDLCPDLTRTQSDNNNDLPNHAEDSRDTSLRRFSKNVSESTEYALSDELKTDFEFLQEELEKYRGFHISQWLKFILGRLYIVAGNCLLTYDIHIT